MTVRTLSVLLLAAACTLGTTGLAEAQSSTQRPKSIRATTRPTSTVTLESPDGKPLPSAESILKRSVDASRIAKAWKGSRGRITRASLSMSSDAFKGDVTIYQKDPGLLRSVVNLSGLGRMEQGYDGKVVWANDPIMGARVLEGAEAEQFRMQYDPTALSRPDEIFTKVETLRLTKFGDHRVHEVLMVTKDGTKMKGFFDVETGHQVGMEMTMSTMMGDLPVKTTMENYREFEGALLPATMKAVAMGIDTNFTITAIELDPEQMPSFEPPAAIKALAAEQAGGTATAPPTTAAPSASTRPATAGSGR